MFVVDTNVLVYAADVSAPEHAWGRMLLERWRVQHGAWYLTWGNCYEFQWFSRIPACCDNRGPVSPPRSF